MLYSPKFYYKNVLSSRSSNTFFQLLSSLVARSYRNLSQDLVVFQMAQKTFFFQRSLGLRSFGLSDSSRSGYLMSSTMSARNQFLEAGGIAPCQSACRACVMPWVWYPAAGNKKERKDKGKKKRKVGWFLLHFFLFFLAIFHFDILGGTNFVLFSF